MFSLCSGDEEVKSEDRNVKLLNLTWPAKCEITGLVLYFDVEKC